MKKIITAFILFGIMFSLGVCNASDENAFLAYMSENGTIYKITADVPDGKYPLAIFSANELYSVNIIEIKDQKADANISLSSEDYSIKLFSDIGTDRVNILKTVSSSLDDYKLPAVYANEAIAQGAFSVIKDVNVILNEKDEIVTKIEAFYQGREIVIELSDDAVVSCNNEELSEYHLTPVSELLPGDIVFFKRNLSGKVLSVDLIFKAPAHNIITDADTDILFSSSQSKLTSDFGIIATPIKNNVLVLYDSTGLLDNALYLDLHPETVVYCYDNNKRKNKLTIGSIYDIQSSILWGSFDDDMNIVDFGTQYEYTYAYARVYDDVVCDIIVYMGYTG